MYKMTSFLSAAALAAVLGSTPTLGADLGGDCCADLEERIAELEATTVRKGNRRVSLKLSGHVNRAVLWFDNEEESNVYAIDHGSSSTRFRLTGGANISSDVKALFNIELGVYSARGLNVDELDDDAAGGGLGSRVVVRKAWWALESKTLGRITVGTMDSVTDDLYEISLGGEFTAIYHNAISTGDNLGVYTTANANDLITGNSSGVVSTFIFENEEGDQDLVRYDSPTLMGFKLSASWGEDDAWGVALRYANEFGDFRVAAGLGYAENTDLASGAVTSVDQRNSWGTAVSVKHTPTGLFVSGSYSEREREFELAGRQDEDRNQWAVTAGITQKFIPLGSTTLAASYGDYEGYETTATTGVGIAAGLSDDAEVLKFGFVQVIDAAAMELYLGYQNFSFDLNRTATGQAIEDVQTVLAGARIKF